MLKEREFHFIFWTKWSSGTFDQNRLLKDQNYDVKRSEREREKSARHTNHICSPAPSPSPSLSLCLNARTQEKSNITQQAASYETLISKMLPVVSFESNQWQEWDNLCQQNHKPISHMLQMLFIQIFFSLLLFISSTQTLDFQTICQAGIRQDNTK